MDSRLEALRSDIAQLKSSIEDIKGRLANGGLGDVRAARRPLGAGPRKRHSLQGHFNKIYALDWAGLQNDDRLVSASQDGKLIVWNARTRHKINVVPLRSNWVMTCAFDRCEGRFVASGGLDNIVTIYDVGTATGANGSSAANGGNSGSNSAAGSVASTSAVGAISPPAAGKAGDAAVSLGAGPGRGSVGAATTLSSATAAAGGLVARPGRPLELQGHDGYISCARFVGSHHLVSASGDSTLIYWDVARGVDVAHFTDHSADVMSVAVQPSNPAVLVSGSCDTTARVWDTRAGRCVQTFVGHDGDVNAVAFMPHGSAFGTGSDDGAIRIFDLRSYARVNELGSAAVVCGVTSLAFSASGRVAFGGYDDALCLGWDTLAVSPPGGAGAGAGPAFTLRGHGNRVSCVGVNRSGQALATGSWDTEVALYS